MKARTSRKLHSQTAFTLVELLVVIAIIGVLVALLLPAIQAAREAARRSQCANNLKQVGIAFQNYHAARGHFAPGWSEDDRASVPERINNLAWGFHILPYAELSTLYDQFDPDKQSSAGTPGGALDNVDLLGTNVSLYRCPSNAPEQDYAVFAAYSSYNPSIPRFAMSNYVGSSSICQPCNFGYLLPYETVASGCPVGMSGALSRNSETGADDITDGTSQTLLVGERTFGPESYGPFWAGLPGPSSNSTACWSGLVTAHLRTLHQPTLPMINGHSIGFSSDHPGGVQVVYCDGSVHFMQDNIQVITLASLIQVQDGNVVQEGI